MGVRLVISRMGCGRDLTKFDGWCYLHCVINGTVDVDINDESGTTPEEDVTWWSKIECPRFQEWVLGSILPGGK